LNDISRLSGDFFMTDTFYSPREKIAPVQKIAVVGVNFSQPNNGGAIFAQTVIMNKSYGGECFMIGVHEEIAPLCLGPFFHGDENLT